MKEIQLRNFYFLKKLQEIFSETKYIKLWYNNPLCLNTTSTEEPSNKEDNNKSQVLMWIIT